jgi:type II secretion system protein J
MNIRIRNLKLAAVGTQPGAARGFTLLEVLLALLVLGMVMVAVHSVFQGAIALRNKTDEAFTEAIPLEHTLMVIKRDVSNLVVPGGTLSGDLQTTPTTASSSSLAHMGQQCGPTFCTASGVINDLDPWSELRKVTYYLNPPTNNLPGYALVRSVNRNLLPVVQDDFTDQTLMNGVYNLTFEFYDGSAWVSDWDSTSSGSATTSSTTVSNALPVGVRVQLTLIDAAGVVDRNPIEMVIPVEVQAPTNTTESAESGG